MSKGQAQYSGGHPRRRAVVLCEYRRKSVSEVNTMLSQDCSKSCEYSRLFKIMWILRSVWARTVWSQWSKAARPLSGGKWKQTKEFRCLTNTELVSAENDSVTVVGYFFAPPTFCLEEGLHIYVSENWNIGCISSWQYKTRHPRALKFGFKAALLTRTIGHYFKINYM